MTVLFGLGFASIASAAPPSDWLDQVQSSWENTQNFCGQTVLATATGDATVMTTGKRCVDRKRGILTEVDTPIGAAVEIRLWREFWQYDPATPFVFHLIVPDGVDVPRKPFGEDLGDWVSLMAARQSEIRVLDDLTIHNRAHWRIVLPQAVDGREAVWMIDPDLKLPVAMELREGSQVVLSVGYTQLSTNLDIPDQYFQIRPPMHASTVEVEWDPTQDPQDVIRLATLELQAQLGEELGTSPISPE